MKRIYIWNFEPFEVFFFGLPCGWYKSGLVFPVPYSGGVFATIFNFAQAIFCGYPTISGPCRNNPGLNEAQATYLKIVYPPEIISIWHMDMKGHPICELDMNMSSGWIAGDYLSQSMYMLGKFGDALHFLVIGEEGCLWVILLMRDEHEF